MQQEEEAKGFLSRLGNWWMDYAKAVGMAFRGMGRDNISMMASGMVYSTLIAIIPCLTFLFAFLSAFGVLQPFMSLIKVMSIDTFGEETGQQLVEYIEQFSSNAMSLGVFGLISFIFTGILLVNKIYIVINRIFRSRPSSGTVKRFTTFLTLLILGAFMVVGIFAVQSSVDNTILTMTRGEAGSGNMLYTLLILLFGWLLLFLLYKAVPSARVRFASAAVGATTCIISLTIATAVFRSITATMVSYSVIYGSMASIFMALLYLYITWFVVFFSAELSFVHQFRPDKTYIMGDTESPAHQISEAVNALLLISDRYRRGGGAMGQKEIMRRLAIPAQRLSPYLSDLEDAGMVMAVNAQRTLFVPARPLEQVKLSAVITALFGTFDNESIDTIGEAVAMDFLHRGIADVSSITIENLLERV